MKYSTICRFSRSYQRAANFLFTRRLHNSLPEFDVKYICDPNNVNFIEENINRRKGVGNIRLVQELHQRIQETNRNVNETDIEKFYEEIKRLPNDTHPEVLDYGNDPKVVKYVGDKRKFNFKPKEFHELAKTLNIIRTEQLGNVAGNRSYYLFGILAEIEQALIRYTVKRLLSEGYRLISVPDILRSDVIESCGMSTSGERTQVYKLDPAHGEELCLSGTSEMAIAGYFANKILPVEKLPLKLAAVSRCYRAETSSTAEEKGIYRVHQFTKVEMFALTKPTESEDLLESFRTFQERHFESLGLHFQVLDMPPHELGAPAYRKYDIETWLPGRKIYGEISSCSNCTDYQSRRLNIKYEEGKNLSHVHTVNGTACAIPRMLIALLETYQNENGSIDIPHNLQPYLRNQQAISKLKRVPELKLKKTKR